MSLTPDFLETCRDQKILIIEPFYWTPHAETGLEVAEILSANNIVDYAGPDALRVVTDETWRPRTRLRIALAPKRRLSQYLTPRARAYSNAELAQLINRDNAPATEFDFGSPGTEELKFEDFDVGMGVVSSVTSLTRDAHYDRAHHRKLSTALGRDAIKLYRLTQELVRANGYDLVFLFNGRVASCRAIRRACENMGVRYIVHERGSSTDKYALFDCATPHQPAAMRGWVDNWWAFGRQPEADGWAWLAKRRKRISTDWYTFTSRQQPGHCPPRNGRKRVTYFTSSEDELVAIGDELRPDSPYCRQEYAIRALGDACRERGHEFVVRMHPNTPAGERELTAAAHEVSPWVVEPASAVDTYALMDSSDVVATHSSTAGMEAAVAGKPVFYTGRNYLEHCTSVRRIMVDADVTAALDTPEPLDSADALRYAYFFGFHGIPHVHYQPRGFLSGSYRGTDLNGALSGLRDVKLRLTRGGT
jgi:hypothetical protein